MGWLNDEGLAYLWSKLKAYISEKSGGITIADLEGFRTKNTTFNSDGSITETDSDGNTKKTVFNSDGSITETFNDGTKTITKKTTISSSGNITEVIT